MGQGLNLLCSCNADLGADDAPGASLTRMQCATMNSKCGVEVLLEACKDVSLQDAEPPKKKTGLRRPLLKRCQRSSQGDGNLTALMVAAQFGSTQRISHLLSEGAEVDAVDSQGWTALHWAAQEGQTDACIALLSASADIDATNTDGNTPLQLAKAEDPETAVKISRFLQRR
mmetsp:Transcript_2254/g.6416  ORF Transcript_2254/g.6416 Transcript_2254/m.6416 type:complete len:172 (-) Transcript_2254:84-599(-)